MGDFGITAFGFTDGVNIADMRKPAERRAQGQLGTDPGRDARRGGVGRFQRRLNAALTSRCVP